MERLESGAETAGGAITANPRLMSQALRARRAFDRPAPAQGARGALDYAAGVTAGIPVIGDLLGLGRDVAQFQAEPESRTPMNVGLAALGLIPFVPPAVSYGLGKLAKSRGVEIAPPPAGPASSQAGAIVYHGSPHRFDRFDSSKIGTGEGAQAYGHGLYLADNPAVAKGYAEKLGSPEIILGGKAYSRTPDGYGWADSSGRLVSSGSPTMTALNRMDASQNNAASALNVTNEWLSRAQGAKNQNDIAYESGVLDLLRGAQTGGVGSLYTVDLPDPAIARMLDWDKPLSQQPAGVRKTFPTTFDEARGLGAQARALRKQADAIYGINPAAAIALDKRAASLDLQRGAIGQENATGADLYRILLNRNPQEAADILRQQGIPGIRYLDGVSRGQGAGTSNYVVFPGNENLLTIQEINGQPVQSVIDALRRSR
jgi:hypothetical protein